MLNKFKIALAGSIAASMASGAAHAATETVGADAEIVPAVTIDNVVNVNFGTIASSSSTNGNIFISADPTPTRTCGPLTCTGSFSNGAIDVTASSGQVVSVSIPSPGFNMTNGTGGVMSTGVQFANGLATSSYTSTGTDTVRIAANVTVGFNQPTGTYSGTFNINADYQ